MTQATIFEAYKALMKLSRQELPIREAWGVARLMETLKPFWKFQMDEERKFLDKCQWENAGDGNITFAEAKDAKAFGEKIDEILSLEQEVEVKPIKLALTDDIKLTAQEVQALEGFVEFTED